MTTACNAVGTTSIFIFSTYGYNLNYLNQLKHVFNDMLLLRLIYFQRVFDYAIVEFVEDNPPSVGTLNEALLGLFKFISH
jgi:hypothetical protein